MWHCSCPGAVCRHMRTLGLLGRPNRGYHNHHNSPGRHCHLKNKHRTKQQISTNLLSHWQDSCLCVHSFMAFSNVSPWNREHKVLLHCPLRTNFLLFWDAGGTRGIIFNHTSSKLWETLEKRAIWHSFSFHRHNSLCGQWHLRKGRRGEKHSFVRKLSLIKLRHGDNNRVSFREGLKGIAWANEIKTAL